MIVMAIDPGICTGLAFKIGGMYKVAVATDTRDVWKLVWEDKPDLVLIEQFQAQHISRYGLRTVELVGAVESLCWAANIKFVRRIPQHREPGIAGAVRWLEANPQVARTMQHHIDALAHIFAYERQNGTFE